MEPAIEKAEKRIEYLSSDEETMNIYWERERSLHERANMVNSAFNKGVEQGKTEVIYEVAIKLLDILDDKTISDTTGLDIETVKKLRKENL